MHSFFQIATASRPLLKEGFSKMRKLGSRPKSSGKCCSTSHLSSLYTFLLLSTGLQWSSNIPVVSGQKEKLCNRWGGSSTLSGDRIYYTGGWVRSTSDKVTVQMDLLSIDISNSWKWDEVELAEEGSNGGPSEDDPVPILLSSKDELYRIEGSSDPEETGELRIDAINIGAIGAGWGSLSFATEDSDYHGISNFVYAQSISSNDGYAVGQPRGEDSDGIVMVVKFDIKDANVLILGPPQLSLPLHGVLVHLPLGSSGILAYFGGKSNGKDNVSSMERVHIFDIQTSKWHVQQTTGNAPTFNEDGSILCSAYVAAKDGSSHSLYVFGGDGNVFILSLPSFTWTQVPPWDDKLAVPNYVPTLKSEVVTQGAGTCTVGPGGRQVVMFGLQTEKEEDVCANGKSIYVYDLTQLAWQESFDPEKEDEGYTVPVIVSRKVGGEGSGGADMLRPERGWATAELASVFKPTSGGTNIDDDDGEPDTVLPGQPVEPGNRPPTDETEKKGGSNMGPIVGGVVGAIIVVALIFLIVFLRHRRRRRNFSDFANKPANLGTPPPPPAPPKNQSEHPEVHVSSGGESIYSRSYTPRPGARSSVFKKPSLDATYVSKGGMINRSATATPVSGYRTSFIAELPGSPTTQSLRGPPSVRRPYAHSHEGSLASNHALELPARAGTRPFAASNRRVSTQFGELEGDATFPVEKMDDNISAVEGLNYNDSHSGTQVSNHQRPGTRTESTTVALSPLISPFVDPNTPILGLENSTVSRIGSSSVPSGPKGNSSNVVKTEIVLQNLTKEGARVDEGKPQWTKPRLVEVTRSKSMRKNASPPTKLTDEKYQLTAVTEVLPIPTKGESGSVNHELKPRIAGTEKSVRVDPHQDPFNRTNSTTSFPELLRSEASSIISDGTDREEALSRQ